MVAAVWLLIGPLPARGREARAAKLRTIRTEVGATAYDADAIAGRLNRAEEDGPTVPTIAYGLLKLRSQQQPL
jgi:hypothetical protein